MQSNITFARIMGIQVGVHFSWFAVFALVTWSLGAVYFPGQYPAWAIEAAWLAGLAASLLFFASVVGHELAHSLVARHLGIEVESITLFIFGGMASIAREAERARDEFWIAIAGPLASLGLAVAFGAVWILTDGLGGPWQIAAAIASWLATINFLLAIFNLVPGFPMDGGRVLRSLIWGVSGNYWLATRVAAIAGQVVAYLLVLGGLYLAVSGAFINAVWIILVGWFLHSAARASYRQAAVRETLKGVTVDEAMTRDYRAISPYASLREAFERYFQPYRLAAIPVVADDSRMLGLLTEADMKQVPEERWDYTPVNDAMTGIAQTTVVAPQDDVNEVLISLSGDVGDTPVVDQGQLVGLLTRDGILSILRRRQSRDPETTG